MSVLLFVTNCYACRIRMRRYLRGFFSRQIWLCDPRGRLFRTYVYELRCSHELLPEVLPVEIDICASSLSGDVRICKSSKPRLPCRLSLSFVDTGDSFGRFFRFLSSLIRFGCVERHLPGAPFLQPRPRLAVPLHGPQAFRWTMGSWVARRWAQTQVVSSQ